MINKYALIDEMLKLAPSEYARNIDFCTHLSTLFKRYLKLLDEFEGGKDDEWKPLLKRITFHCSSLERAINYYYEGKPTKAYSLLSAHFSSLPKWIAHHRFCCYRMREMDEGSVPTFEGMFHIPFKNRGIVRTQRYSAPGIPCLYLGLSPYTCWQEVGCPDISKVYVSIFKPESHFSYLNFTLPIKAILGGEDNKILYLVLEYFPFVIASMVKVRDNNNPFKPEYIIPQMALQWVMDQREVTDDPEKKYIGILYTSVHIDRNNSDVLKYANIVIPAYFAGEERYSYILNQWFSFSDPIRVCPQGHSSAEKTDAEVAKSLEMELKNIARNPLKRILFKDNEIPKIYSEKVCPKLARSV